MCTRVTLTLITSRAAIKTISSRFPYLPQKLNLYTNRRSTYSYSTVRIYRVKDRNKNRDKDSDQDRNKGRDKGKDKDRDNDRDRENRRDKDRDKGRDKDSQNRHKDKGRDKDRHKDYIAVKKFYLLRILNNSIKSSHKRLLLKF